MSQEERGNGKHSFEPCSHKIVIKNLLMARKVEAISGVQQGP